MKTDHIEAIVTRQPVYAVVREKFLEHFPLFWKLGTFNYAALMDHDELHPFHSEIAAIFLCGMALERIGEISEHCGSGDPDMWGPMAAWSVIQDEVKTLLEDGEPIPEPATIIDRRRKWNK
jgi:hypothetical protein